MWQQIAYDGQWRDADPVEVQKKIDAGETYTYRFRVPPGKVVTINDQVRPPPPHTPGPASHRFQHCLVRGVRGFVIGLVHTIG